MTVNHDQRDKSIDEQWAQVMRRCEKILPLFADLRLGLNASAAAETIGLNGARELDRWLVMKRLPPFRRLRPWIYLEQMVTRFDDEQTLNRWAEQRGYRGSVYYRFVVRETGQQWGDLKRLGPQWVRRHALNAWSAFLS